MQSMTGHIVTAITSEPIDVEDAISEVAAPEHGGIAIFVGTVRDSPSADQESSAPVISLEYDAHPRLASERLEQIAREAAEKWSLGRVVAIHRVATCNVGEPTVVVACGAPHRAEALDACRWMIDTIKGTVPIWKREIYADGSSWVGAGA
jgi:molybdopterin synthase catalytic subunit